MVGFLEDALEKQSGPCVPRPLYLEDDRISEGQSRCLERK
jgi:hypothetical protein